MGNSVEHNSRQIAKYLETHSGLVGPGARPDQPFGKKHRGSTRVPISDALDRFIFANRVAAWYITPEVKAVLKSSARYGDVYFSELLTELYRNPAIIRTWRAEATPEDAKEHLAFQKMCRFIADLIRGYAPNLQLQVDVNPRDEPQPDKPTAAYQDRKRDTRDAYRKIVASLEELESRTGLPREQAKLRLLAETDAYGGPATSLGKINDAIAFVKAERENYDKAQRDWRQAQRHGRIA